MSKNLIETILGAAVIIIAAFFVYTAVNSSGVGKAKDGYSISATFDKIDGISVGSDVRIGGIKIGSVTGQKLDTKTYRAVLELSIKKDVQLPTDSSAEISSEGLLGGKYVNLTPGAMDEFLQTGDEIEFTQSSVNIEQLIGKMAFGGAEEKGEKSDKAEEKTQETEPQQPAQPDAL